MLLSMMISFPKSGEVGLKSLLLTVPALVLMLEGNRAESQIREWKVGGSGVAWSDVEHLMVLGDITSIPGALQPLELHPDDNIVPVIYGAHRFELWQKPPNPMWEPGIPRYWRGSGNYGPATPGSSTAVMVDGDPTTFWAQSNFGPGGCKMTQEFHTLAPGGPLPLERFILRMPPEDIVDIFGEPMSHYVPGNGELSAGWHGAEKQSAQEQADDIRGYNHLVSYEPYSDILGAVKNNIEAPLIFDFPLNYYNHVRWRTFANNVDEARTGCPQVDQLGYADLELYGRGFAGEGFFRSQVLDLGRAAILGSAQVSISKWRREPGSWDETENAEGDVVEREWIPGAMVEAPDADAEVVVRVKTGLTSDSNQYFTYSDFGELVSVELEEWELLEDSAFIRCHGKCSPGGGFDRTYPGWRGPVVEDRENWTPWSGPVRGGSTRLSLSKGQYFQLRVDMTSRQPTDVARLDSVRIEIVPLLVADLLGEVALEAETTRANLAELPLGEPAELTYAIRADFGGRRGGGFDAIRIATPSRPDFLHLMRGDPLEAVDVADEDVEVEEGGLTIFLDEPVDGDEELRVGLRTTLYTVSEKLRGEVYDRAASEQRQVIEAGNATDAIATDQLQIVSEGDIPDVFAELRVEPRTITPNGDGSNDELMIRYSLLGVIDAEVQIGIYTVAGQPVRRLAIDGQDAGINPPVMWNGRDESGELVAPGLYLCQVETETSRGRFASTTPIAIAY